MGRTKEKMLEIFLAEMRVSAGFEIRAIEEHELTSEMVEKHYNRHRAMLDMCYRCGAITFDERQQFLDVVGMMHREGQAGLLNTQVISATDLDGEVQQIHLLSFGKQND